jgi:hypothetical protein
LNELLGFNYEEKQMTWKYEKTEENEPLSPDIWRVYDDSDGSYEATVCELWSGEHDNESLAKEICESHNAKIAYEYLEIPSFLRRGSD